ncbi:MAG: S9 family peptidase [Pseudomonadota bacterium]|nr:S9 family peptidase [Pseudomonadota bacterium]
MAGRKKNFDVDALWQIERVGALALSPDGAQAACSLTRHSMHDNTSATSLWLLSTFGGEPRRLTSCGEKDGQPAWSPRGGSIAFVAKREQEGKKDETAQLYVIAADGGEARRVSNFGPGIDAFKWFADGKRIAFVAWVWPDLKGSKAQNKRAKEWKERKETAYVTSEGQYRYWDRNLPMGRVAHLHVLDVASGRVVDLFEGLPYELQRMDPDANVFDVAPDGRHIAFAFDPAPEKRLDNRRAIAEVNLRTGRIATVALDPAWDFEAPRYSPDGARIAFVASNVGRKHTALANLALLERGGKWRPLTSAWDRSVNVPLRWSADGAALYFIAEERARCHLWRYSTESRSAAIAVEGGWVHAFDVAADTVVTGADTMQHPVRVEARRDGAAALRIEHFNDALLSAYRFAKPEQKTVTGANGEPVHMWLLHPPGFDAAKDKTWPVLHSIHGGPHAVSGDTFHYRWNNQLFAAQGYVVACVNYHGSSSFGDAFSDSITHRWGELELQDVEAATDWLRKQPWVNRKRIFATGGSYGGYMVAWMNGHVKAGRYQAYVCHAGCFDWRAMFADDAYTWHARELGANYWDDPAKVQSQSPDTFAGNMTTPTLVIHGALDYRVPDQQGLAYYNTLKARGVDARLVWFPDENHWVLKPRNAKLWYAEFFAWLKAHDLHGR